MSKTTTAQWLCMAILVIANQVTAFTQLPLPSSTTPTFRVAMPRDHLDQDAEAQAKAKALLSSKNNNVVDPFLQTAFSSECDNINRPPSLNILIQSLRRLSGMDSSIGGSSDIRGQFVDHASVGSLATVAHSLGRLPMGAVPPLTPFAAYCFGHALASQLLETFQINNSNNNDEDSALTIALGQDPRVHGRRIVDALARGAESADDRISVVYNNDMAATTPACASFVRMGLADAAVMVTASHLPADRNGLKFFNARIGGYTASQIQDLGARAIMCAEEWYGRGILPPSSGPEAVMCRGGWVDWMPLYAQELQKAVEDKVGSKRPLEGLRIVLNSGNGSGGFFAKALQELGADTTGSLHLEEDGTFPFGVPNPESPKMVEDTIKACEAHQADLGILLDTDADRCGFVMPSSDGSTGFEPLNRNRLIALLGVMLARTDPGCTVVTDSVTSEGLAAFLTNIGLNHERYLKGYANVINRAKELTATKATTSAEIAIETSGHCAFRENDYLDDGTFCAVQVVSLLANEKVKNPSASLLSLIDDLEELDEVVELRIPVKDDSLETMQRAFDLCALEIEILAESRPDWQMDTENLEGIRIRLDEGQFFMLRKSLHDPVMSLQVEAVNTERARAIVQALLVKTFGGSQVHSLLDVSKLEAY